MIKNITEDIYKIADKYYDITGDYFRDYREENGTDVYFEDELNDFFTANKIISSVKTVNGFDSSGYTVDFIIIAWLEDNVIQQWSFKIESF